MPLKLTINSVETTVDVAPDTPLLWVLRDVLNYTGTKYGCGMGLCGACTVHVDGRPTRSCLARVSSMEGKAITTIEGLSPDGAHPVQLAWEAIDVPQCGYCQAGQIMSAAALLATHAPSHGRRDRHRHERQPVPLRNLSPHPSGHSRGRRCRRNHQQVEGRLESCVSIADRFFS